LCAARSDNLAVTQKLIEGWRKSANRSAKSNLIRAKFLSSMPTGLKKSSEDHSFTLRAKKIIKKVPEGKVATYGQVATLAGNPRGARQVVRILCSYWEKDKLPWHRIVNRQGKISLKPNQGYEIQKQMLRDEGVIFREDDTIDFDRFLWSPVRRMK
jgi:methylated-DNA-protein-cysteine methyltransferase-like protein